MFSTLEHDEQFCTLQWRHNGQVNVSNHQRLNFYLTVSTDIDQRKHQSSASLAFVRGIEFAAQMASNAENVPIWWRHHVSHLTKFMRVRIKYNYLFCWSRASWNENKPIETHQLHEPVYWRMIICSVYVDNFVYDVSKILHLNGVPF